MDEIGLPAGRRLWYVLIHQLPARPLYLRAKVRRRLARIGALAIKNSIYVLPARAECLEDFQWIAQEALAGGGDAQVCQAAFLEGLTDNELVERFRQDAAMRLEPIRKALEQLLRDARPARAPVAGRRRDHRLDVRRRAQEALRADFFESAAGKEVQTLMAAIDRIQQSRRTGASRGEEAPSRSDLVGRTWVTRRDPHIDRLATAWLIRRFIDPAARFRFVDPAGAPLRRGEQSFDMVGATFGHEGDRCTFETMLDRLDLEAPALRQIAEIVHDLDLKDARFGRPDADGVGQLVRGLCESEPGDQARVTAALPLFDALYASFAGSRPPALRATRGPARRRRR